MKALIAIVIFPILIGFSFSYPGNGDRGGRIVGGDNATIDEFPFTLSLQYFGNHQCGASVLSEDWVLTAAHCFGSSDPLFDFLTVRAGSSFHRHGGTEHLVESLVRHEGFKPNFDNDIALLKLKEPLVFSNIVKPVRLPQIGEDPDDGAAVTALGWGWVLTGGPLADQLQKVNLSMVSRERCGEVFDEDFTDNMICAHFPNGGKDSCNGDSGGPLVQGDTQVGIVSFGPRECGHPTIPGVYTRLSMYRDWIKNHTQLEL